MIRELEDHKAALREQIRELRSRFIHNGRASQIDYALMYQYADIKVAIEKLNLTNQQCLRREELNAARDEAKTAMMQSQAEIYLRQQETINTELARIADILHEKTAPVLTFTNSSEYTYEIPGDDGAGSKFMSLAMFDHAILNLTELPILIHDTPVYTEISKERTAHLIRLGVNHTKQTFIAQGSPDAILPEIQGETGKHTIINLADGNQSLFGYLSNLEPEERTFGIPAGDLPKCEPKC